MSLNCKNLVDVGEPCFLGVNSNSFGTFPDFKLDTYYLNYKVIFLKNFDILLGFVLQLDINTVAAGGGSQLFFRSGMFVVGPESARANPGPTCYCKGTLDNTSLVKPTHSSAVKQ